ncbi:virulence protein [Shewanella sp. Choline-02u-19]|uniref:virulence protein n=1 Tax=unclassified Shewanella TaxID=196818 RepID=UPI000C3316BD|nr:MULTISPECIES: virulence protein [unclassified Shewanella]PKG57159.1 virulence protein [Shewanella sp. GutDb-MelDb]PKG75223.1 virulence protein [Shewanella sp. GutCb]PKH59306.1 virulence protein [Shewanella sp. Bg11-22]PKI29184.1 virulence protein [Shewanella sp. Choline-02u-19]
MFKFLKIMAISTMLFCIAPVHAIEREPHQVRYDRTFPIWAQEAIDLGHELPKPFGFSVNYMSMEQPLIVDSVAFSGLGGLDDLLSIKGSEAQQESETITFRADAWVLPFLNLYGVIGHTKGSSVANVQLEADWSSVLPPLVCKINPCQSVSDPFDFELNFKGTTYGVGGTLVGGIGNWFALLDINYTNTNLDILDGEISSIVVSPRAGYRTSYNNHDIQIWAGAMYQNVEQTFSGYLQDIGIPLGKAKFEVNQHLEDKWNGLIGGQIGVTKNIDLLMELGIGTRTSFMMSLGYRF